MAVANPSSTWPYCTLTDREVDEIEIIVEQIDGLADLLSSHLGLERDNPGLTAVNVMREKARAAAKIVRSGIATASAIRRAGS